MQCSFLSHGHLVIMLGMPTLWATNCRQLQARRRCQWSPSHTGSQARATAGDGQCQARIQSRQWGSQASSAQSPQCRHWVTVTCLSRVCHDSPIVWFKPWCFQQSPPAAGNIGPADPAELLPVKVSKVYSLEGPNNHGAMPSRKKGSTKSNKSNN